MKHLKTFFYCLLLTPLFFACTETEPAPGSDALLANKDWNTDGLYVSNTKTVSPNLKLRFVNATLKSTTINGQNIALTVWSVNAAGTELVIKYPDVSLSDGKFSVNPLTLKSQTLKINKLTATELWVTTPDDNDIQLFGFINLTKNSEYRFTTGTSSANTVTSTELTGVTWTGSGSANAGLFVNTVKSKDVTQTFKFSTSFGFNLLTIQGIPSPATWSLNEAKTVLTIVYPKSTTFESGVLNLNISKLDADELNLTSTSNVSLYDIFTFGATGELKLIPYVAL
jgi:hypothetical protein